VYCSFPGLRTQPAAEHRLKGERDLTGRSGLGRRGEEREERIKGK
jgi:hypothetical protein